MFKIGDKVFDNERGYDEGEVTNINPEGWLVIKFESGIETYRTDGRWISQSPITLFKKEEKMNYYYVGQKVSHQGFGDGVVESIDSEITGYPVMVDFEKVNRSFTLDGRYNDSEHPSLSQKPHFPLELEEVVSFEKGELVWVKQGVWQARYYSHFNGSNHGYFINQEKSGMVNYTQEIRKFSDNPLI